MSFLKSASMYISLLYLSTPEQPTQKVMAKPKAKAEAEDEGKAKGHQPGGGDRFPPNYSKPINSGLFLARSSVRVLPINAIIRGGRFRSTVLISSCKAASLPAPRTTFVE